MADGGAQAVLVVMRQTGSRETPSPDDTRTPPAALNLAAGIRAPAKEPRMWNGGYELPDAEACHLWQAWHPTGAYYSQYLYRFRGV